MPAFGSSSLAQLATCDPKLQRLFVEIVKTYDCKVIEGFRGKEAQNYAFNHNLSDVKWPDGNHNKRPSAAVDVYPFPIRNLKSASYLKQMVHFAGYVKARAEALGIAIRWGGDWDSDLDFTDQGLIDYPHFELGGLRGKSNAKSRTRSRC